MSFINELNPEARVRLREIAQAERRTEEGQAIVMLERALVGQPARPNGTDAIIEALRTNGPMKPSEIARQTGLAAAGIYTLLKRQVATGAVRKSFGLYSLP